jgi:hypothetical protein
MQESGPAIRLGDAIKRRLSRWRWCFPASSEATPAGQVIRMPCRCRRDSELDLECDPNPSAQVPKSASASRKRGRSNQHCARGGRGKPSKCQKGGPDMTILRTTVHGGDCLRCSRISISNGISPPAGIPRPKERLIKTRQLHLIPRPVIARAQGELL